MGEFALPVGHRVGRVTKEIDPVTGELVEVVTVDTGGGGGKAGKSVPVRQRDPGHGTVHLNMEAVWLLALYLRSHSAVVLAMEAARRFKLGMEPLAMTYAVQQQLGLTKRGTRTALDALQSAQDSLGWFAVTRTGHRAASVGLTELGFQNIWANPRPKRAAGRLSLPAA